MEEIYRSYLGFLNSMSRGLESLTGLNEKKLAAAQADDLTVLNELLNQEQAQALNFRGLELARDKLLAQLGLAGVPLSKVPGRFPPAMQPGRQWRRCRTATRPTGGPPERRGRFWNRTSTRWRALSYSWGGLPPADRGARAMGKSRRAAPRPRL